MRALVHYQKLPGCKKKDENNQLVKVIMNNVFNLT